jgi:hypothetical protein
MTIFFFGLFEFFADKHLFLTTNFLKKENKTKQITNPVKKNNIFYKKQRKKNPKKKNLGQ